MLRTDALQNVLAFLAVKAAQGVPTEDIHAKRFGYLVPKSFDTMSLSAISWFRIPSGAKLHAFFVTSRATGRKSGIRAKVDSVDFGPAQLPGLGDETKGQDRHRE